MYVYDAFLAYLWKRAQSRSAIREADVDDVSPLGKVARNHMPGQEAERLVAVAI